MLKFGAGIFAHVNRLLYDDEPQKSDEARKELWPLTATAVNRPGTYHLRKGKEFFKAFTRTMTSVPPSYSTIFSN